MGLMATFLAAICAASKRAGTALKEFVKKAAPLFDAAKRKVREYRLFAQRKTKEIKNKLVAKMAALVDKVQSGLGKAIEVAQEKKQKLARYGKVAWTKTVQLHQTMKRLLPQIRYWLKTGYVAANKVISLQIPELYSVVRGKVGKAVEFGLSWGIARLKGGFLVATMGRDRKQIQDSKFAVQAVNDHIAAFGRAPRAYAYDRGGHSGDNVAALKKLKVRHIGLAPRGRCQWEVEGSIKTRLMSERAQVEGGIGAIKCSRYGFHRPKARSLEMMGVAGQRAVLGFNLNKLVRELARREEIALV